MSQAIGNVVFGFPANDAMLPVAKELGIAEGMVNPMAQEVLEGYGFQFPYSGNANPSYFGVDLDGISEHNDVRVSKLKLEPTDEQRADFQAQFDTLPQELRDCCPEPEVWIIWSSS